MTKIYVFTVKIKKERIMKKYNAYKRLDKWFGWRNIETKIQNHVLADICNRVSWKLFITYPDTSARPESFTLEARYLIPDPVTGGMSLKEQSAETLVCNNIPDDVQCAVI
jgi:hypothetical protein